MPNTEKKKKTKKKKKQAFRFIKTPYLDKMTCFLVPWRLIVEINIPYDVLMTGYFVFEKH